MTDEEVKYLRFATEGDKTKRDLFKLALDRRYFINALVKENKELKEQIEKMKFLLDVDNNELIRENLGLKAQIENMKNVGNCEHSLNCARWVQQHISSNKVTCCKGCLEWELNK